jgi:homoserine O-acetyltransferase
MTEHKKITISKALKLDSGIDVSDFEIAYNEWGELNAARDNVILVFHALTGDQYVAGKHPITGKSGWWNDVLGKGKILDTSKYYVICANVIGGCMGSFGPASINPKTNQQYGVDFPIITISDIVNAHDLLLQELGIDKIYAAVGGSMGGMQVLEFCAKFPMRCELAVAIATTSRHSAQNIAFHEIGRQAIMADPDWCGGKYAAEDKKPRKGLSVARMTAHVTYMSEESLQDKFGRRLQDKEQITYGFDADFQVESYLRHQGIAFVDRFDANSYLYLTRAMDYFDMEEEYGKHLAEIFRGNTAKFLIISFTSDWCYPTEESKYVARALNGAGVNVSFVEIETSKGHDAFLLDEPEFKQALKGFIG